MGSPTDSLPTSAFDYDLPPDRVAQHPAGRRDESRLLVLDRQSGGIRHRIFRDIVELIPAGDALVLNETRVFPARFVGRKPTGARGEVLLLRPLRPGRVADSGRRGSVLFTAESAESAETSRNPGDRSNRDHAGDSEYRETGVDPGSAPAGRSRPAENAESPDKKNKNSPPNPPREADSAPESPPDPGTPPRSPRSLRLNKERPNQPASVFPEAITAETWEAIVRPGGKLKPGRVLDVAEDLRIEILDSTPEGGRIIRLDTPLPVEEAIRRHGRVPLPPYIQREADAEDAERYQTVYARRAGSVAAPTAGLHFTPAVLEALADKGVRIVRVVLHVGVGTFRPVEFENPDEHEMHAEEYEVSPESAAELNEVRRAGGALWAVGTTVARTLETVTDEHGVVHAGSGRTRLFIKPPYEFRGVDRLVTNFHLPRSTLLMLVSAFGGYERIMEAYREAVAEGYRFYSYGDAMVIV